MNGLNKVMLIGNLGKDPDLRHLDSGTAIATFPFATSESYRDREGNRIDKTEWHNIVVWRNLAEIAEKILKKGSKTYIEGKLTSRSWTDKEGNRRNITEIVADNIILLERPKRRDEDEYGSNDENIESDSDVDPSDFSGDDLSY